MDFETSSHRKHWLFAPEHLAEVRLRSQRDALRKLAAAYRMEQKKMTGTSAAGAATSTGATGPLSPAASPGADDMGTGNSTTSQPMSLVQANDQDDAAPSIELPVQPLTLFEERLLLVRALSKLHHVGTEKNSPHFKRPIHPRVLTAAMALTQRFFVLQSTMQYDPVHIAATALFLAGKTEENYVERFSAALAFGIDESIISSLEPALLEGVRFDINIYSPFPVVTALIQGFIDVMKSDAITNEISVDIARTTRSNYSNYLHIHEGVPTILLGDANEESAGDAQQVKSLSLLAPSAEEFWQYLLDRSRVLLYRMYLTDAIFLMTPAQLAYGALLFATEGFCVDYLKQVEQVQAAAASGSEARVNAFTDVHGPTAIWLHAFLLSSVALSAPADQSGTVEDSPQLRLLQNRIIPSVATAIEQGKALSTSHVKLCNPTVEELNRRADVLRRTYGTLMNDTVGKLLLIAEAKRMQRASELAVQRQQVEEQLLLGTPQSSVRGGQQPSEMGSGGTPMFLKRGNFNITPSPMSTTSSAASSELGLRRGRLDLDTPGSDMGIKRICDSSPDM